MPSVLVVEDDSMISEIYQRKFESAGFDVGIALSGKEALKKARENKFDLVLLDLVLPEMNGIDVLKEIKKSGKYNAGTKVIIVSNLTDKEQQDKAYENGADGYITKSQFNPSELVKEVKRILNQYKEEDKAVEKEESITSAGSQGSKKKILYIEDEDVFLEMFGKKLESEGYEVEYAKNGAWGLEVAQSKNFDLIITDMIMPAMTGVEIIERLKLEERTKDLPIIALSASMDEKDLKKVKDMGVKDYFVKTRIVPSDLSKKVDEILKTD